MHSVMHVVAMLSLLYMLAYVICMMITFSHLHATCNHYMWHAIHIGHACCVPASTGGFMIITGFTCTFLCPELLAHCNLRAKAAAVPAAEAEGLEHVYGQFQLWVLERVQEACSETLFQALAMAPLCADAQVAH